MPLLLLPSASNQKHPPFPEWRRGKDDDSGVCNIEDRLLQRRSPGTEFGLDWSSSACDEFGSSPAPMKLTKFSHISVRMREERHWLPVSLRIQFKVTLTMWKCIAGYAPGYLQDLCHLLSTISDRRQTRSSVASRFLLEVSRARTVTMQKRAFAYAGPTLRNNMPEAIRSSAQIQLKHLKPLLFSQFWFPPYDMFMLNRLNSFNCRRTKIRGLNFVNWTLRVAEIYI